MFTLEYVYTGEDKIHLVCKDKEAVLTRNCGQHIQTSLNGPVNQFYQTICGLRPKRRVTFILWTWGCGEKGNSRQFEVLTPPSAPVVVHRFEDKPEAEHPTQGFIPHEIIDWIPQNADWIDGYAVYQALSKMDAVRLLCWVPLRGSKYSGGSISFPTRRVNNTYADPSVILGAYMSNLEVHQAVELWVAARTLGQGESPAVRISVNGHLLLNSEQKCLREFGSDVPEFAGETGVSEHPSGARRLAETSFVDSKAGEGGIRFHPKLADWSVRWYIVVAIFLPVACIVRQHCRLRNGMDYWGPSRVQYERHSPQRGRVVQSRDRDLGEAEFSFPPAPS
jgi:hypothetical protein